MWAKKVQFGLIVKNSIDSSVMIMYRVKYHKLQFISERLSFARLVKCWWGKQGQTCQGFQLKATSFTVLSNKDIIFAHLQHFLFYGPEIFLLL